MQFLWLFGHPFSSSRFGQVSKSLSSLGLASSPSIQQQLEQECRKRLDQHNRSLDVGAANTGSPWWLLDILECLAGAADECRSSQSGVVPSFWQTTFNALCPVLVGLVSHLTSTEAATLYRSLRHLPPSLVRPEKSSQLHEELALRCMGLATVEAFDFIQLTSVVYSQLCLYPELCLSEHANPSWTALSSSWKTTSEAWKRFEGHQPEAQDAQSQFQVRHVKPWRSAASIKCACQCVGPFQALLKNNLRLFDYLNSRCHHHLHHCFGGSTCNCVCCGGGP